MVIVSVGLAFFGGGHLLQHRRLTVLFLLLSLWENSSVKSYIVGIHLPNVPIYAQLNNSHHVKKKWLKYYKWIKKKGFFWAFFWCEKQWAAPLQKKPKKQPKVKNTEKKAQIGESAGDPLYVVIMDI